MYTTQHKNEIKTGGKITVTPDNKEVIDRLENNTQPLNTAETWKPKYNLWKIMIELKEKIPVDVHANWVKGHQDTLPSGEKMYGPFPREVELNILMDKYAGLASVQTVGINDYMLYYCNICVMLLTTVVGYTTIVKATVSTLDKTN